MAVNVSNPLCPHCHVFAPLDHGKCTHCGKPPDNRNALQERATFPIRVVPRPEPATAGKGA